MSEQIIHLDKFKPRGYQLSMFTAIEKGFKRILLIWPRRAGKDICAYNLLIREALKRVGTYFYVFPQFSSGRRILWDALDLDGFRILDYLPKELIESRNEQMMRIKLVNGSVIQILGSDRFDTSIVGTNSLGMIFSEYSLQSPLPYKYARPILSASNGFAMMLSTPRGKNHLWDLYQIAQNSDDWYCSRLTITDTKHIPLEEIEKERQLGELSEDMILQEYYCDFSMGVEGAYYAKYLDKMYLNGKVGVVNYEHGFKVHTAWDIGVRDSTVIIFFQIIGTNIHIIDCYENNKKGLEHYAEVVQKKGYLYGYHIAPHDIKVMEFGSGLTRIEKASQLGIEFTVAPDMSIEDGIEAVRTTFSKLYIDKEKCGQLLKALENYRQEFDIKHKIYKGRPLHDWSSHFADCMRYLCISLPKTKDGLSTEELSRIRNEALYGDTNAMPSFFRNNYR